MNLVCVVQLALGVEWQSADKTSNAVAYLRALLRIECGAPSIEWNLYEQVQIPALQQAKHVEILVRADDDKVTWLIAGDDVFCHVVGR